jgi:hypothetical protein
MTAEQLNNAREVLKSFEKPAYKSKKFFAWFLQEAALTTMAILALRWQDNLGWPLSAFMLGIVFTMGFAYISYNGKTAMLEMYTRGMALVGKVPDSLKSVVPDALQGNSGDASQK